jgi:hypothetical protein
MLTFKATGEADLLGLADEFGRLGSVWRVPEDAVVANPTEDDITAEDVGWHYDMDAPGLTTRSGGPFATLPEVVKAVQDTYDEFADDRAREQRFDYRQGKRVISIPSGGQSRK